MKEIDENRSAAFLRYSLVALFIKIKSRSAPAIVVDAVCLWGIRFISAIYWKRTRTNQRLRQSLIGKTMESFVQYFFETYGKSFGTTAKVISNKLIYAVRRATRRNSHEGWLLAEFG